MTTYFVQIPDYNLNLLVDGEDMGEALVNAFQEIDAMTQGVVEEVRAIIEQVTE